MAIVQTLWAILRQLGGESVKVPKSSEILRWFSLPAMAKAMADDEASEEALAMFESVKRMAERQKERNGNDSQT